MPKRILSKTEFSMFLATVIATLSRLLHDVVFPPDRMQTPIDRLPALDDCLELLRQTVGDVVDAVHSIGCNRSDRPIQIVDELIREWQVALSYTVDDGYPSPIAFRSKVENLISSLRVIAVGCQSRLPSCLRWWELAKCILDGKTVFANATRPRHESVTDKSSQLRIELQPPYEFDQRSEYWQLCDPKRIDDLCEEIGVRLCDLYPKSNSCRFAYLPSERLPERIQPIWSRLETGVGILRGLVDARRDRSAATSGIRPLRERKSKTAIIREQRIKFCRPRIAKGMSWQEIFTKYREKYPSDIKASADTLRLTTDRNSG